MRKKGFGDGKGTKKYMEKRSLDEKGYSNTWSMMIIVMNRSQGRIIQK